MDKKFEFLKSTRFWAMVVFSFFVYFEQKGIIGEDEIWLIGTILGGFTSIRTIDRFSEKMGTNNETLN